MNFDNVGKVELFKTEIDWELGKIMDETNDKN